MGSNAKDQAREGNGQGVEVYTPATPTVGSAMAAGFAAPSAGALALAARVDAEVRARTSLAIMRPRNIGEFRRHLLEACKRSRFAAAARYLKPIGSGKVPGLSIRFAEECCRHYTNLDNTSIVIQEDDERRVLECCSVDMESNVVWRQTVVVPKTVERRQKKAGDEVIRERVNAQGDRVFIRRATEDETFTLQNNLISKTIRNMILKHIPSDIIEEANDEILKTLESEVDKDPTAFRRRLLDAFFNIGVTPKEIDEYLAKPIADANKAELEMLRALGEAIKQGEGSWADVMEERRGLAKNRSDQADVAAGAPGGGAMASIKGKLDATKGPVVT